LQNSALKRFYQLFLSIKSNFFHPLMNDGLEALYRSAPAGFSRVWYQTVGSFELIHKELKFLPEQPYFFPDQ
jgi:hypothetical protein